MAKNLSTHLVFRTTEFARDAFPLFSGCPVHWIPVEILHKIFLYCLTEERAPHRHLAPLLLCQVCSRWRQVTLQQPELWDEVWLHQDKRHSAENTRTIFTESLKLWLDCLGKRQLSASIRLLPPPDQPEQQESLKVMPSQSYIDPLIQRLLLPYSNMFRALSLDVSSEAELIQFFQMSPGRLMTLETLKLRFGYHLDNMSSFSAFKDAPRLKSLAIEIENEFSLGEVNTQFPWSQLTCLYLGNYVDVGSWHTIIRQCPLIQRCSLGIQAMLEEDVFQNENTTFLFLTHFRLTLTGPAFPPVFHGLFFPALEELHIADNNNEPECGFPPWAQPLEFYGQFSNLRELILYQQEITLPDFFLVLRATTSLVKLAIDSNFNFDHLMDALVFHPEKENLIPHLENLLLRVVDKDRPKRRYPVFSTPPFIRMVRSRWWANDSSQVQYVARLQEVSLDIDDHRKEDLIKVSQELVPFITQGLRVSTRLIAWEEWLEEQPWPFSDDWWRKSLEGA